MKANKEIREKVKNSGVPYWKIAARLRISEGTLCRWLRIELDAKTKEKILSTIENIERDEREGE